MKREHAAMLAQHRMERFGFVDAYAGLLETPIVFDFKLHVTVPLEYIYATLEDSSNMRTFCLNMPWREQMSSRFLFYLNRVALPEVD